MRQEDGLPQISASPQGRPPRSFHPPPRKWRRQSRPWGRIQRRLRQALPWCGPPIRRPARCPGGAYLPRPRPRSSQASRLPPSPAVGVARRDGMGAVWGDPFRTWMWIRSGAAGVAGHGSARMWALVVAQSAEAGQNRWHPQSNQTSHPASEPRSPPTETAETETETTATATTETTAAAEAEATTAEATIQFGAAIQLGTIAAVEVAAWAQPGKAAEPSKAARTEPALTPREHPTAYSDHRTAKSTPQTRRKGPQTRRAGSWVAVGDSQTA